MNDQMRQHKSLAIGGDLVSIPAIEGPFGQIKSSDIPRGEMKDGKRKGSDQDSDGDKY